MRRAILKIPSWIMILTVSLSCTASDPPSQGDNENLEENKGIKILYLTRHAKSSWKDQMLSDFERPLKKRGRKDAKLIGKVLNDRGIIPDLILSSPANRALSTAIILADKMNYPRDDIQTNEDIYETGMSRIMEILNGLSDSLETIMIVGHNPTFTNLANYLSDKSFDNVPTCGIVAIGFEESWSEISRESGKVLFFEYPKKYKE
ncbi:MAG: histidine phosphatase family protein [Bacteroidetes bacterium]|nr:histidine phosphatase family protein [Bacteroidota bacterium]